MKKEERVVYIELCKEIDACLCTFCKYAEWESDGCCEGHPICNHPISKVAQDDERMTEPGADCWGFRPNMSVSLISDLIGAILTQRYKQWQFIRYSTSQLTVFGQIDRDKTSKVRLGYNKGE